MKDAVDRSSILGDSVPVSFCDATTFLNRLARLAFPILLACLCLQCHAQTNEWTWIGGSSTGNQPTVYGTLGTPAQGNTPGRRFYPLGWTDRSGRLWLFGGQSGGANGNLDNFNDLWTFDPSTNQWTWMGGSNTVGNCVLNQSSNTYYCGQAGVYGTLGTPAAGNFPGSHYSSSSWTDSSGNLWFFGGCGIDVNGSFGCLNDLWEFNPSTNLWAWMGGGETVNQTGATYGLLGIPAAGNMPGGRVYASSWTDKSGHFWLFGGRGSGTGGNYGDLNDLWEFDPSANEWAWTSGSSTIGNNCVQTASETFCGQPGVYGTLGTPAAGNAPGGREDATSWTDNRGHLWLFGGVGFDANGKDDILNDLWEFNPSTDQWTWVSGGNSAGSNCIEAAQQFADSQANICGQSGIYGTPGTFAAGNTPGSRYSTASWTDSSGNLWLFGGMGLDANGKWGTLNDLWELDPSINQWAWMGGSNSVGSDCAQGASPLTCGQPGVYGTLGTPAALNTPGGRAYAANWTGSSGNFWLFGGIGFDGSGNFSELSDVWMYQPSPASLPAAAAPTFSPAAGIYTAAQAVAISDATAGATIYYTTDGTAPTTGSSVYNGAIEVAQSETLEAFAAAAGYGNSAVATANYTITQPAATPVFSVPAGAYAAVQTVTISDATAGATIYFTLDGTTPTTSSTVYSGPVTVSSPETIEAIATANGYTASAVATAGYLITPLAAGGALEWTWVGGANSMYQPGVYGALGVFAAGNIPRSRWQAANWTDSNGNFWLFGGAAPEGGPRPQINNVAPWELNDLWEFSPKTNAWAWMGGSSTAPPWNGESYYLGSPCNNACGWPGVYGTLGTPAAGNIPGSRQGASTWTDSSGNLWLFGGWGMDGSGNWGDLNDLWKFNPQTNQWAWTGGSNTVSLMPNGGYGQPGVYGTLATPAAANIPSSRQGAMSWTGSNGNLWLFGGEGPEASGTWGDGGVGSSSNGVWSELNDLWEFNPQTNEWTWMGGSSTAGSNGGQAGVYGKLGTPAAGNFPGSRENATTWIDSSGNFWLFGGYGFDSSSIEGALNDLWEFKPSSNQWAWMGGSSTTRCTGCGFPGVYGTPGAAEASNNPGGRDGASGWVDGGGHLWLFGGQGIDASGNWSFLNDLWVFNLPTKEWAWMGGSSTGYYMPNTSNPLDEGGYGQPGVWGTLGVPAACNIPGGSWYATNWTDSSGNFWLFGGYDFGADGNYGGMNALWKYQPPSSLFATPTATPVFSPAAGVFTSAQSVTITDATPGAAIYYTTDGVTTPTTGSTLYTGAITVSESETIEAIAVATNYLDSPVATAAYTINLQQAAMPAFSVGAGTYTAAQTVTITDATAGATIYYTTDGTAPSASSSVYSGPIVVASSETIEAIADANGYVNSTVATAAYTLNISTNPNPVIAGMSPASATAGGAALTLTVNGYEFIPSSTVYWGASALATTYVSASQLTAQVTAADLSTAGITTITVQSPAPGGGTSNSFQFEVDSASGTTTAPTFSATTAVVATGSTANYPVTLPSTVTTTTVTCLNLPPGATCNYSSTSNAVTIATSPTTPAGTYQVTVVFSETVSGAATSWIFFPLLLVPVVLIRRKLAARGIWLTAGLGLVFLAALISSGCGGGTPSSSPPPTTHQVTSSGVVGITVR